MEILIIFAIFFTIINVILAKKYKRDEGGWAILGLIFGIFSTLILLALGEKGDGHIK